MPGERIPGIAAPEHLTVCLTFALFLYEFYISRVFVYNSVTFSNWRFFKSRRTHLDSLFFSIVLI